MGVNVEDFPIKGAEVKTVVKVDYSDLDDFLSLIYGREYESIAFEEWSNYEDHEFEVKPEPYDSYDKNDFHAWIEGTRKYPPMYSTRHILNDLCHKGLIPPCTLLVHVFW